MIGTERGILLFRKKLLAASAVDEIKTPMATLITASWAIYLSIARYRPNLMKAAIEMPKVIARQNRLFGVRGT